MATFEYETKKGIKYGCRCYLGIDELTGKQVNLNKRGFDTKKEAEVYLLREQLGFKEGERKKKANEHTFREVYDQWLEIYKNDVKESTFAKRKQEYSLHILPNFGDLIISKITPDYIQKKVNEWHTQFRKYRRIYNYFKSIMSFAINQGIIDFNPCDRVTIPKKKLEYKTNDASTRFLSTSELEVFLNTIKKHEDSHWYTMFRLFAFSGIRRGELLALTWDDIDFKSNTLSVNKALSEVENNLVVQTPKTKLSERIISLDDLTIDNLRHWKIEQAELLLGFGYNAMNPKQLIFSNSKNNNFLQVTAPYNALARITKKHNLTMISPHGFRHTHCSLLFEAGVPMKDVKERLGHSSIKTTMDIYTHVTQDSKDKSAQLFANYVNF